MFCLDKFLFFCADFIFVFINQIVEKNDIIFGGLYGFWKDYNW